MIYHTKFETRITKPTAQCFFYAYHLLNTVPQIGDPVYHPKVGESTIKFIFGKLALVKNTAGKTSMVKVKNLHRLGLTIGELS